MAITAFLSRSPGLLNLGSGGPASLWHLLSNWSELKPILTSCRRGYIIIRHPPTSCKCHNFALNSTPRQSRSLLISSTRCTCYLHWCISSFDSLAGSEVNMQRLLHIFSLCTVKCQMTSTDESTALRSFASILSIIWRRVEIREFVDRFLRNSFRFFQKIFLGIRLIKNFVGYYKT